VTTPTWILAIATSILAISGPIALFAWLSARRQDRERRQQDRERQQQQRDEEARERILKSARDEFVPKGWLGVGAVLGIVVAAIAWSDKNDRKR
jgi:hypothetical protein